MKMENPTVTTAMNGSQDARNSGPSPPRKSPGASSPPLVSANSKTNQTSNGRIADTSDMNGQSKRTASSTSSDTQRRSTPNQPQKPQNWGPRSTVPTTSAMQSQSSNQAPNMRPQFRQNQPNAQRPNGPNAAPIVATQAGMYVGNPNAQFPYVSAEHANEMHNANIPSENFMMYQNSRAPNGVGARFQGAAQAAQNAFPMQNVGMIGFAPQNSNRVGGMMNTYANNQNRPSRPYNGNGAAQAGETLSKTNLYIRGLPPTMSDEDLYNLCAQYGKISSTKAILDKNSGTCKGYGFVDFDELREAEVALKALQTKGMQVQMAKAQEPDPTNLYFANLSQYVSESDLEAMINQFGKVISTRILRDQQHKSRGVGFARMDSKEVCERIIETFNGKALAGCPEPLIVKFADSANKKKTHPSPRPMHRNAGVAMAGQWGGDPSLAASMSPYDMAQMAGQGGMPLANVRYGMHQMAYAPPAAAMPWQYPTAGTPSMMPTQGGGAPAGQMPGPTAGMMHAGAANPATGQIDSAGAYAQAIPQLAQQMAQMGISSQYPQSYQYAQFANMYASLAAHGQGNAGAPQNQQSNEEHPHIHASHMSDGIASQASHGNPPASINASYATYTNTNMSK